MASWVGMTFGDRIIELVAKASLVELASAQFLVVSDEATGEDDAERVADAIVGAIAKKNQFVASEPAFAASVERDVDAMFDELAEGEDRAIVMARHVKSLSALFRASLGDTPREVTSAEYSPELQLSVLGLSPSSMRDPILDIGCGADAALVRFLRALGKNARGVDREAPTDVAERGDWLKFDYGTSKLGTITSHLGFSLHFMHQEMKRSDLAYEYARAYMRIVRALAPGGTFAYVPGLPFIEAMLPKELRVARVGLSRELVTENVSRVQEATGLVLDTATHVTRAYGTQIAR